MNRFGIRPQPASTDVLEELAGFAVDAAVLTTDGY